MRGVSPVPAYMEQLLNYFTIPLHTEIGLPGARHRGGWRLVVVERAAEAGSGPERCLGCVFAGVTVTDAYAREDSLSVMINRRLHY